MALWQLAFRPFFLFGSLFGAFAIGFWVLFLSGAAGGGPSSFPAVIWHAHEMVYGFSAAVIGGFLLTAVQNWTGIRGVHGPKLAALFILWLLPRVLLLVSPGPSLWLSALDLSFYPALAACMVPYFRDPELKTERVFFLFFSLFFGGNLLVHLDALGILPGYSLDAIRFGLNLVVIMVVFIGGRVIPFFTESELSRKQPRTWKWIEVASMASAWIFLLVATFKRDSVWMAGVGLATAAVHLTRLVGWQVPRIRRIPLLWVLHVSYLWLVAGYFLTALAALGWVAGSAAIHAFAAGSVGMVIHGMISRVSLGHTGRRLHPSAWTVAGYILLVAASVARVAASLPGHSLYQPLLIAAGALWTGAFAILGVVYAPILLRPRLDGKEG